MLDAISHPRRDLPEVDPLLLWSSMLLLCIGLIMVYSASITIAGDSEKFGNQSSYFLVRQGIFLCIGLCAASVAFMVPSEIWRQWAPRLFLAGIVLLGLVLIPQIGIVVNGARRWLPMGVFNLQPSEMMKLFAVLYAADFTVRKMDLMHSLKRTFLPMAVAMILVGGLLLGEPDFGAFVVIVSISFGVLFLGGMRALPFVVLIVLLASSFAVLIMTSPYRMERLLGFVDPWKDEFGKGYQLTHSLIAFGRGEVFGTGLGTSVEKLHYLPEAHTDFLLAIIAEELGLIGVFVVIVLFALLIQRAFVIGKQSVLLDRVFHALVAMGMAVWLGVQGLINMGVNVGLLPTKGLTMPLMSYGGSSLVMSCVALGILLRIDWENRQLMSGKSIKIVEAFRRGKPQNSRAGKRGSVS